VGAVGLLFWALTIAPAVAHEEGHMAMTLTSSAFQQGGVIPKQYTCDGADLSPPLNWTTPPAGTKGFALIADDPDAPAGTWVHWVVYNIPADERKLAENLPKTPKLRSGALQGTTDFRRPGYGGPCPPPGPAHRYFFKLYALDIQLELPANATKAQLEAAMKDHILNEGQLLGYYQR
jgi:Raf kinase inhibitor-like YbhB/YbcL family protein